MAGDSHTRRARLGVLLAAAVIISIAALGAGTATSTPDAEPHLLLVPAGADLSGVHAIERYDAFTLVEAAGAAAARLREAGAAERDDMRYVALGGEAVDPSRDRPQLGGKGTPIDGPGLALVQFEGPVKDAWLASLRETGARVVTYMAENAYLVHGSEAELHEVAGLIGTEPAVRAVIAFEPGDKVAAGVRRDGEQALAVQTLSGADGAPVRQGLATAEARDRSAVGPYRTLHVVADAGDARALAADPGVIAVLPDLAPELHDEAANQIVAGNVLAGPPRVPSAPGYLAFHDGLGVGTSVYNFAIDITDEGLSEGTTATVHPDLHIGGSLVNASRIAYNHNWTSDANGADCGGHGTINAGIAAGFNDGTGSAGANAVEDAAGYNYGLGVAPLALVGGSKIFDCAGNFVLGNTITGLSSAAFNATARISNNSWGSPVFGAYNAFSQEYDRVVRDADPNAPGNQGMVEVMSAGNEGSSGANTVGAPGTAKNVITVGASENVRAIGGADGCGIPDSGADDARDIIGFSSRGPTDDGRIKPDIVAPGTHMVGPKTQNGTYNGTGVCNASFPAGNNLYAISSGTSQAAPMVAGMAALVRRWYLGNVGGTPSPAMTKAMLVGATTDSAGGAGVGGNAPNMNQGWGLANLPGTLVAADRHHYDQSRVFGGSGDHFARSYEVANTGQPVRVTLAWTDPPGPTIGNAFVNNLDLTVTAGGETYRGNVFASGNSVPGGTADAANNLEVVRLPAGVSGEIRVQVTATNIAGDGVPGNADGTDQDFALVVANAGPEITRPDLAAAGNTPVERGDGDGALEPGEAFALGATLANGGSGPATGITGTVTGANVSMYRGSSAFPDLGVELAASSATPFVGKIATAQQCGAPLQLTLAISAAEGGTSAALALPTGAVGSPVSHAGSAALPAAIPDNNPTGVTVGLSRPEIGLVRDVNVSIGSLTHSFAGDLRIQLVHPDGTTVTLQDRQGGAGDNLASTVYDDEAATAIQAGAAPFTGSFRPVQALSAFDRKPSGGTWQLRVADLATDDVGTLQSWSQALSPADCTSAPTPPSVGFIASPANAEPGGAVTLLSTASDNGPIEEQRWDLDGDGAFDDATGVSTAITFATAGAHQVGLEVVDDRLDTYSARQAVQVGGGGPGPGPGPGPADPRVTFTGARIIRANGRGVFSFRFTVSPPGLRGGVRFGKLGRKAFTVPANGRVTVEVKLKRKQRARLRRKGRLGARATVTLSGKTFTRRFTLKPPKKRR